MILLIPNKLIPWSSSINNCRFIFYFVKIISVSLYVFDLDQYFSRTSVLINLASYSIILFLKVVFLNSYDYLYDGILNLTCSFVVSLSGITLLFFDHGAGKDKMIAIGTATIFPFVVISVYVGIKLRQTLIMKVMQENKFTKSSQIEYGLYLLSELVKNAIDEPEGNYYYFSKVMIMLETHQVSCTDVMCPCRHTRILKQLMR
jgi:hypothetical protein